MRRIVSTSLLALTVVAMAACAGSYQGTSGARYDRYEIYPEEIEAIEGQVNNLHVVIERLRPMWLTENTLVYQDQQLLGGTEVLRRLPPDYATESLEYLDRSQASARLPGLGSRRIDGVIWIQR